MTAHATRLSAYLCALFVFACTFEQREVLPPAGCDLAPPIDDPPSFQVGVLDALTLHFSAVCSLGRSKTVDIEVTDAHGAPVPAQAELIRSSTTDDAVISFTPQTTGTYHVVALFQPSLGRSQKDVLVVEAKPAPMLQNFAAPRVDLCEDMLVTRHNGLLCVESTRARLIRLDGAVQEVTTTRLAVNGDAVWTQHSDNAIRRYVDDGTRLALQPEASLPSRRLEQGLWVASHDVSVWVGEPEIVHYWVENGALTSSRAPFTAPLPTNPVAGLLLPGGDALAAWHDESPEETVICRIPSHSAQPREPHCDTFAGNVVGTHEEGLWVYHAAGSRLRLISLDENGLAHVSSRPLPIDLVTYESPGTGTQPVVPTSNRTLVAFAAGEKIDFEDWGVNGRAGVVWPRAGTLVYRETKDDGHVQVLRR